MTCGRLPWMNWGWFGAAGAGHALSSPERRPGGHRSARPLPTLPAAVEVAAYRIVLEALTNVVRHAEARTCSVRLALSDVLTIEVSDDGLGLPSQHRAGVGLSSMRERAAELGGTCVIAAGSAGGHPGPGAAPVGKGVIDGTHSRVDR